jgi:prolyl oligopeptidase
MRELRGEPADPYLWLEEIEGSDALTWVAERSAETAAALVDSGEFRRLERRLLAVLDSDARIPRVQAIGAHLYDFWRDEKHARGLWRRTSLAEFRRDTPTWETVLDLDALASAERQSWVWAEPAVLRPQATRCLVQLSRGGGDAHVVREFDLVARRFVPDGFALPEQKSQVSWRDEHTLFVGCDFGPDSLTRAGTPRLVKEWRRGSALEDAELVFAGEPDDAAVSAFRDATPGFERDFVLRMPTFFSNRLYLRRAGELVEIEKPLDAIALAWREWLILRLRSSLRIGKRELPAGALLAAPFDDWLAGKREVDVLFEPSERRVLADWTATRSHVLVVERDNLRCRIQVLTPGAERWRRAPAAAPERATLSVAPLDAEASDEYFVSGADFLAPPVLMLGRAGEAKLELLKQLPPQFDASRLAATWHEAVSTDGTRIPYARLARNDLALDGRNPTLLFGYGGFEIPMLPDYLSHVGAGWLEQGGVWAIANLRGGGEFGPAWHQAALLERRPRAYEDFEAVAEDLIRSGVTSPAHLGAMGRSNGGLLVGNALTRRPELFGAIVCWVPVLDMRRYHRLLAGAAWMAEYGDPDDAAQWEWIRGISPYHNVRLDGVYPPVLFMTSTRDDRVHPGHARKMAARMRDQGHRVLYYEGLEGGHPGAADNPQQAFIWSLVFRFLTERLSPA